MASADASTLVCDGSLGRYGEVHKGLGGPWRGHGGCGMKKGKQEGKVHEFGSAAAAAAGKHDGDEERWMRETGPVWACQGMIGALCMFIH